MTSRPVSCAVCGAPRNRAEGWFLLVENRWTDRLKILRFQDSLAQHPAVYSVCCVGHVRELVVHWMTTAELDTPFARVPLQPRPASSHCRPASDSLTTPDPPRATVLGELSVHRESLTRLLQTSPYALSSVLEALIAAIQTETRPAFQPPVTPWLGIDEPLPV